MIGNRRLTPPQSRRVNSLAKKSCCNCDNGKCMLLDDGEECVCPQLISYSVPIHLKLTLTIKEAAEYSNIGINKIDTLLKQPNCPFVLFVGTRKLVKRREFEEYIRRELII